MDTHPNNYVVGRGELYVDLFAPGTKTYQGERYLGNTPALTNSTSSDTLDHFDSDHGLRVKDESVDISNELTGSFTTDNISGDTLAMFFSGAKQKATVVSSMAVVDADRPVKRTFNYQIGTSTALPNGTRDIDNVTFAKITPGVLPTDPEVVTPVLIPNNFDVDLQRARFYIESDAPDIVDGDVLRVTYDQNGSTREVVIGRSDSMRGSLRFLSTNPVGERRDYFWPYVKITPNGDYALKGDDWQVVGFNFEVLKLDANTERVYIDGNAVTTP